MGRGQELTVVGYLLQENGPPRLITDLTPEELAAQRRIWNERMSQVMSDYYTHHLDEYIAAVKWVQERDEKKRKAEEQKGDGENGDTGDCMGGAGGRPAAG